MDTDGYASRGRVEFVTTREELSAGVTELARSLGQKPIESLGFAKFGGRTISRKWRVTWRPTLDVFSLDRKKRGPAFEFYSSDASKSPPYDSWRRGNHSKPMRCITVDSRHSLFLAGSSMIATHNTRTGAEWVRACACGATPLTGGSYSRIALVAETAADARDVMVEGPSGLLAVHPSAFRPKFESSKRRVTWPNGAIATLYNATEPDQLRGPAARRRLVRRTRQMALRSRNLGHAPIRVAARG